ncbi:MAG: ATPase, partial [Thermoflexia bacterium]
MLFVGVDAGGTHTRALIADERGEVRGAGKAGPGNWEIVGLEGTLAALCQAVGEALAAAGARPEEVAASAFGLAGLDWPSDEERL